MERPRCLRPEFDKCPYREKDKDAVFHHMKRCLGITLKEAREASPSLCYSTPCLYAIEVALKDLSIDLTNNILNDGVGDGL